MIVHYEFKPTKVWLMIHNWKIQVVSYMLWPPHIINDRDEPIHEFRMWPDDNRFTMVYPQDFDGAKDKFEQRIREWALE